MTDAARRLARVLERGVEQIVIEQLGERSRRLVLTPEAAARLEVAPPLAAEGERVEIGGRLLMADFSATREKARIHRQLGPPVTCTFPPELEATVLRLLRRYVRATGRAAVVSA